MKLPSLFNRKKTAIANKAQNQSEKMLADLFRTLGDICTRLADVIEKQRLEREGYEKQDKFLERLDKQKDA